MKLKIRGWVFETHELAQLPPFTCKVAEPARSVLADGAALAQLYLGQGCDCKRLAAKLGLRYKLTRQALGWYGLFPVTPVPLKGAEAVLFEGWTPPPLPVPAQSRPKTRRRWHLPPPDAPAALITKEQLRLLVYRVYLKHDRCPVGCLGAERCGDPGGKCQYAALEEGYSA